MPTRPRPSRNSRCSSWAACVALALAGCAAISGSANALDRQAALSVSTTVVSSCTISVEEPGASVACHAAPAPRVEAPQVVAFAGDPRTFTVTTLQF